MKNCKYNINAMKYFESPSQIADFVIGIVFVILVMYFAFRFKFSRFIKVLLAICCSALFLVTFFQLWIATYFVFFFTFSVMFICCFSHMGAIRTYFAKYNKGIKHDKLNNKNSKIIDHEALYNEIYETVKTCSYQKIGLLITFERHDDLKGFIKNGTIINAPVSHELLMTIFYPGTRLHDGAVIIKDNMIHAASVYYTPTTKALTGKFGSRHRAAIGISEMSDAVTIVVSEETGRISITQDGEIESVQLDKFIETLSEHVSQSEN